MLKQSIILEKNKDKHIHSTNYMKDKKLLEKGKTKQTNIPTFFNTEDLFKTRNSVVSFKNKK